jgi:hypothetical protein
MDVTAIGFFMIILARTIVNVARGVAATRRLEPRRKKL